jgi:hypothetical protein
VNAVWTTSDGRSWVEDMAVQQMVGGGVVITPDAMEVDRPYPGRFHDEWMVWIKRADGTVDVYRFRASWLERLRRWLRA